MRESQNETDLQLKEEINRHRAGRTLGKTIMNVGFALMLISFFTTQILLMVVFLLLIVIPGALKMSRHETAIKQLLGEHVAQDLVTEVFGPEAGYEPFGHIADDDIIRAQICLPTPDSQDEVRGSDHIRAVYQGLTIELGDIELIHISLDTDDDGNTSKNERTIFKGQWLMCDFSKELSAEVLLSENSKKFPGYLKKKRIQMENETFNSRFLVFSENEHEAYYLLTPHMMEYILGMSGRSGGNMYMSFLRDGKLHVAVDSGKDFFELGKEKTDIEILRNRFRSQIRWFTDLIDELRESKTLFRL